jgi:tRNA pseudouridine55 synthase
MKNGILLIDKPARMSSAGVVARVKRMLGAVRVGHAGTLDPDATGLLILLINGATRVASYAADGLKVYSGEMKLGVRTSTDDISGEVLETSEAIPSWESVLSSVARHTGQIKQVPPNVSAIKVDGKRAYRMHRAGEEFELTAREVTVSRFDVTPTEDPAVFRYVVECTPGTYIRSLARDIGEELGCGGTVLSIRREASGYFAVKDAVSLDEVSWDRLRDWSELIPTVPRLSLPETVVKLLHNGMNTGLHRAWDAWVATGLQNLNSLVVFYSDLDPSSLGMLRIAEGGGFKFEINIKPVAE